MLVLAALCRPGTPGDEPVSVGWRAEWAGTVGRGFSDDEVASLASSADYLVIAKFSNGGNVSRQLDDARRVVEAAADEGRTTKVLAYFSAAFWFDPTREQWGALADEFDPDWLAEDADGNLIPFHGVGSQISDRAGSTRQEPRGHLVDLTDADYRAWVVRTIMGWMSQAPISGIAFDSANLLLGDTTRGSLGDGQTTFNDLMCGPSAAVDAEGNCSEVAAWNDGLRALLREVLEALEPSGGQVLYNGVAAGPLRGPDRNTSLLDEADLTSNEAFCLTVGATGPPRFTDVAADARLMREIAGRGKGIIQVTNYGDDANRRFEPYCRAAFLVGWQPTASWWSFHRGYDAMAATADRPRSDPELGTPRGSGFAQAGDLLTRDFTGGVVAVNTGGRPARWVLPGSGDVRLGQGQPRRRDQGEVVVIRGHSAAFLTRRS